MMIIEGIFIFIIGLVFGSFLNVCIYRIPLEKSIVSPPSACTGCGARLTALDLVPVFSYIFLGGKCRHCKAKISIRYPLVELLTAIVLVSVFMKFGVSVAFLAYGILMMLLIAVFFIDIDHRIIPDELVIAGLVAGLAVFVYNIFAPGKFQFGSDNWWTDRIGLVLIPGILLLVAIIGMIIYKTDDAMGMGDVKLLAPIGFILGWRLGLVALFLSVIVAGVAGLFLIIVRRKGKKDTIPFGPFIVTGTYVALMWGYQILNWYMGTL
ncbi:MAG: prepilin peptidase [Clostridiales bacterium]|nr:prepilin peptidase [Clostridiales bacterium]